MRTDLRAALSGDGLATVGLVAGVATGFALLAGSLRGVRRGRESAPTS